jgi:heme/copper-type cytochrome/quinol oxidase subunit 2
MIRKPPTLSLVWTVMSFIAIVHLAVFEWRIMASPDTFQVQFTPDDAYYYLGLARNYVLTDLWTFDSGISTTSGFHPLLAYLLSFLYRATQPSTSDFVWYGLVLSSLTTLSISISAWYLGLFQNRYPHYMLFIALLFSSTNYALNSVSIMEWPLVVLFSSLYVVCFSRSYKHDNTGRIILLLLGVAGSLSRSDFGLLPFSIFIASIVSFIFLGRNLQKCTIFNSFFGLLGALFGVVMVLTHNYVFSGNFLQSSALMKAHWSQISGPSYWGSAYLLFEVLGWSAPPYILVTIILLFGAALFLLVKSGMKPNDKRLGRTITNEALIELVLAVGATVCIVGYMLVYSRNGGIQRWYTANLVVPIFIVLVIGYKHLSAVLKHRHLQLITAFLTIAVLAIMLRNMISLHFVRTNDLPPWPHQEAMLVAGKYLQHNPLNGRVGSWNAGIIGYYQGGNVVNLDGLVNDNIYDYAVSNRLPSYVLKEDIAYIVDFEPMIINSNQRARGGYDDPDFIANLQPIKVFDQGKDTEWKLLTLYRVSPVKVDN